MQESITWSYGCVFSRGEPPPKESGFPAASLQNHNTRGTNSKKTHPHAPQKELATILTESPPPPPPPSHFRTSCAKSPPLLVQAPNLSLITFPTSRLAKQKSRGTFPILSRDPSFLKTSGDPGKTGGWLKRMGNQPLEERQTNSFSKPPTWSKE